MGSIVADLNGKRVVVTGANSGIGRSTARELAAAGAEVILVCRSPERGGEALEAIREQTQSTQLRLMLCDISSREDVRRFGVEFRSQYDCLDVLVNNAGAYFAEKRISVDGLELTFALNHMGYFLMVRELLGCLKASPAGRIVNVSSEGHRMGKLDWEDVHWERRKYAPMRAYCDSKLMNILYTRELSRRLEETSITVNCLHPGVIRSGFAVNEKGSFAFLARLSGPFMSSPEVGARTSVYLAGSPSVADRSGGYFIRCKTRNPSRAARSDADAARLWELSEALIETAQT
jgi:NAD(P)-dependent dehydrogenase (short-subunit alcohol dehydrogenase family)